MSDLPIDPDLIDEGWRRGAHRVTGSRVPKWDLTILAVVVAGGGVGSMARYGVALWVPTARGGFPWSTLLVNVAGCALIGALMVVVNELWPGARLLRPFLGVGVLGGLTTYSTMTFELRALSSSGEWLTAGGYLFASLLGGLFAVWAGVSGMRRARRRWHRNSAMPPRA